ncbi:MAG: adenylate/guanylate cyclase domain-containing protein, partial [Deltaproteobacteria bacterium]|nr:adenylate/guanylate cyclase domain-containing protein [Deltaproteobacteria bacterium]
MKTPLSHKGQAGKIAALLVGSIIGILAGVIAWLVPSIELATLDLRFLLRGPQASSNSLLLVAIDDQAIEAVTKWSDYARLIEGFKKFGAKIIVTDIVFRHPGADASTLIEATREGGKVVHPIGVKLLPPGDWLEDDALTIDDQPIPDEIIARAYPGAIERGPGLLWVYSVLAAYGPVVEAASGLGHIGVIEDVDGIFRRYPILVSLSGKPFPSTALEVVRLYYGAEPGDVHWHADGVEIRVAKGEPVWIPTDPHGQVLLNYLGKWTDSIFDEMSADDLLKYADDPEMAVKFSEKIKDKICFLGVAGTGIADLSNTPFEIMVPRLLGIATLIDQIISQHFLYLPGSWLAWLMCLMLAVVVTWQAARPSPWALVASGLAGCLSLPLASYFLFVHSGLVVPTAGPLLAVLLAVAAGIGLRLVTAEKARRLVEAAFGRYVSEAVLEKVMGRGQELVARGERKTLTIMFSDILEFSDYCDKVEPEEVRALLNEYLEQMVDCVFSEEGTVDKFIGDGVLAFFGDPLDHPDHALRCIRAGLAMLERVEQLNAGWRAEGRHTIQIRIGINTGPVVVGNVGSARRLEYTVLGEHVNRAQRLEAADTPGCLLIGESTWQQVKDVYPQAECVGEV